MTPLGLGNVGAEDDVGPGLGAGAEVLLAKALDLLLERGTSLVKVSVKLRVNKVEEKLTNCSESGIF